MFQHFVKCSILFAVIFAILVSVPNQAQACGGDGEPSCFPAWPWCDLGNSPNPLNIFRCMECGTTANDGWPCIPLRPTLCQEGYEFAPNPENFLLQCTFCGRHGEPVCVNPPGTTECDPYHQSIQNVINIEDWVFPPPVFGEFLDDLFAAMKALGIFLDPFDFVPNDICTACGGHGEPICKNGWDPECKPGHRNKFELCEYIGLASEPTTNTTTKRVTKTSDQKLWGWADVHEHQFANHAYGGAMFWGAPYHDDGVNTALARCDFTDQFNVVDPFGRDGNSWLIGLPETRGNAVHGDRYPSWSSVVPSQLLTGLTNNGATGNPFAFHGPDGNDGFSSWPSYKNGAHQQMYYKWVKRAYEGGLRLLVNLATTNEILCRMSFQREEYFDENCNDMLSVNRQIQGMHDLEDYVKAHDGGWYRIATSAAQAREIIENGDMAVVIGIEVDTLFGCKPDVGCTPDGVQHLINYYYDELDVRYIFPSHGFDNEFAGAAIGPYVFVYANLLATGKPIELVDCTVEFDHRYSWRINAAYNWIPEKIVDYDWSNVKDIVEFFVNEVMTNLDKLPDMALYIVYEILVDVYGVRPIELFPDDADLYAAHCNKKGLTPLGEDLIHMLMDKRMFIDIDHMSQYTSERVIEIAKDEEYPLVSSHSGITDGDDLGTEKSLTITEAEAIRDLGGFIKAPGARGKCGTSREFLTGGHWDGKDSDFDGIYWEHNHFNYRQVVEFMQEYDAEYPRIALGADMGSFIEQFGPRDNEFEDECWDETAGHEDPVANIQMPFPDQMKLEYPFNRYGTDPSIPEDASFNLSVDFRILPIFPPQLVDFEFNVQFSDEKEADIEVIGPDSIETHGPFDLLTNSIHSIHVSAELPPFPGWPPEKRTIGLRLDFRDHLDYHSVFPDKFWKQRTGDRVFDFNTDGLAHFGLFPDFLADVQVLLANDAVDFSSEPEVVDGNGNSEIFFDNADNYLEPIFRSAEAFVQVWEDIESDPPQITPTVSGVEGLNGWHTSDITVEWEIISHAPLDSSTGCDAVTIDTDTTGITLTCEAESRGGAAQAQVTVKRDATAPLFTIQRTPDAAWTNQDVLVEFEAWDETSGLADSASAQVVVSGEGAGQSASHSFTDRAGLTSIATLDGINIDLTPPVITVASRLPAPGIHGWNNQTVIVSYSAVDLLAGIDPAASDIGDDSVDGEGADQSVSGTAVDLAGNTASITQAGINIDLTPPVIIITTPVEGVEYVLLEEVNAEWSASDVPAGVESAVGSSASGEPIITSPAGIHEFLVEANDKAGNVTSRAVSYEVLSAAAATSKLMEVIHEFELLDGIDVALSVHLRNVLKALDQGKNTKARKNIDDFVKFVEVLRGNKLNDLQADELNQFAELIKGALVEV